MVVKINMSMPEEGLEKLDEAARESKSSRSALLSQAVKTFLEEKEAEQKRERQITAVKEIDRIMESIPPWDATAEVLKWRDKH
jgi:metal-responsive CopG/Arc/MetJ family transcriptional regulator